jgi:Cyclin
MVDAGTQYSPPIDAELSAFERKTPTSSVARLRLTDSEEVGKGASDPNGASQTAVPVHVPPASMTETQSQRAALESPLARGKRSATEDPKTLDKNHNSTGAVQEIDPQQAASKRLRPEKPAVRLMPLQYETCNPHDLAVVISSMLMELIRYNDDLPLRDGHLTRFHSRAPPGISVSDYLQRLTTHATLSPPILLSMVYYIDKLCALYPSFTISSLTVHRFLITSATVASKGLSDSFWTNKTYARVGGVSLKELALLELEFLSRVDWRIVPKPEVLVDYYRSLIERSEGYELDVNGELEENTNSDASALV